MFKLSKNRFNLLYIILVIFVLASFVFRTILLLKSFQLVESNTIEIIRIYAIGSLYDVMAGFYFLIPLGVYFISLPDKIFNNKYHGYFLRFVFFSLTYLIFFIIASEWVFWNEFGKRFNFIAVDYLLFTHEVVHNILESYNVPLILTGVFILSVMVFYLSFVKIVTLQPVFRAKSNFLQRLMRGAMFILLPVMFFYVFDGQNLANISLDQYNDEIAKNGLYSLFSAFRNSVLDYDKNYAKKDINTIFANLRILLRTKNSTFIDDKDLKNVKRFVKNKGAEQKPNVMLIMVESLSAEFMGSYGDERGLTPNLDRIVAKSMFFSNCYATGTRTVRGMEAITLSVPPTPGRSIVKRPGSHNMFSVGQIFKARGYDNKFIYGGHGYFDNMNDFFSHNGFNIVDRTDMSSGEITFSTVWGVCDEDLFNRVLKEADKSYRNHIPFFSFVMTTSNHRPYTYPDSKIDIPSHTGRSGSVKYTDYAIGKLLSDAAGKPWFKNTIFVFVADHNGNSAGRNEVPAWRYKIPFIVYAPGILTPVTVSKLCSQIDIMPTLFSLMHWNYYSKFYGNDILSNDFKERALIGNYQKLGLLRNDKLILLLPGRKIEEYRIMKQTLYDISYKEIQPIEKDKQDVITYYQSASYLYKYRPDRQND